MLDITLIGDQYADMAQWHADGKMLADHLLSVEPFRSRADQIHFHQIDNTASLGTYRDSTNPRLMLVDDRKVTALVEASGIRTDFIGVIVNTPTYGGSGGSITVSYNGADLGPDVFLHEFAHSFASLADEYLYGGSGPLDGTVHSLNPMTPSPGNVYAGVPPATAWNALVAPDEYFLGGTFDNWYRTSLTSIMRAVGVADHFNAISLHALTARLDYWAAHSADRQPPLVEISGLGNGATVSGVVHVATSSSDDRAVTNTQLWVDGNLVRNDWTVPFTLDWLTGSTAPGLHMLRVEAFDASGNVGISSPIMVNLTAGSDFQILSPAPGDSVAGLTIPLDLSMWKDGADHFAAMLDGIPRYVFLDPRTNQWTVGLSSPLDASTHTLTVSASVANPDEAHLRERYRATVTFGGAVAGVIHFRTPGDGAILSGRVIVSAEGAATTPSRVDYFVDGKAIGSSQQAPFVVTWDTKKVKDGRHVLRLIAVDPSGGKTIADRAVIVRNVVDRKGPVVTLTSPRNNAKVKASFVRVSGKATDASGVMAIDLLIDNRMVSAGVLSKFAFTPDVTGLSAGKHKIRIRAYDARGNVGWSKIVTFVRA